MNNLGLTKGLVPDAMTRTSYEFAVAMGAELGPRLAWTTSEPVVPGAHASPLYDCLQLAHPPEHWGLELRVVSWRLVSPERQGEASWDAEMVCEYEVVRVWDGEVVFRRHARFSEFGELHTDMQSCFPSLKQARAVLPPLPKKTWGFSSASKGERFYNQRAEDLENYLRALTLPPRLALSLPYFMLFVGLLDPADFAVHTQRGKARVTPRFDVFGTSDGGTNEDGQDMEPNAMERDGDEDDCI
jgi:hypothetical protein